LPVVFLRVMMKKKKKKKKKKGEESEEMRERVSVSLVGRSN